ncbi:MAG: hypothetical protein QOK37_2885 [Thermoanaerobaculia bacterium]|nr:hypothetical protein [Thermoanaerobaculia bacterium]
MSETNLPDGVTALHTIATLSLDSELPLFAYYPAMKMGVRESVRFYAALLLPLAETIVASHPEITEWVVTAPPLYAIPAGANLIAWEVFRLLTAGGSRDVVMRSVDLRYSLPYLPVIRNTRTNDQSSSSVATRIQSRRQLHEGKWAPKPDPSDFRDRGVLFINDINVTGTQQKYARLTLDRVQPALVHWLYIFQVDPDLGRAHPEIEYNLNYLNLDTFDDFAEAVANADIDFSSRAVGRLFDYPIDKLAPLFRSLDPSRRARLHQLAIQEGVSPDDIDAKLAMLQAS